jgi:hypothetical protein
MKRGLILFNVAVGTPNSPDRGYHETLTRFLVRTVEKAVEGHVTRLGAAIKGLITIASDAVIEFGIRQETIASALARTPASKTNSTAPNTNRN